MMENENLSLFVLVALEGHKVKECMVISDIEAAAGIRRRLQELYGGENICLASVRLDDVPLSLWRGYERH